MTRQDILQKQEEIFQSAQSFRRDANHLMNELAKDYNFTWAESFLQKFIVINATTKETSEMNGLISSMEKIAGSTI